MEATEGYPHSNIPTYRRPHEKMYTVTNVPDIFKNALHWLMPPTQ